MTYQNEQSGGVLEECYQILRERYFDAVVKPPTIDYLRLGLCYDKEIHEHVWGAIDRLSFQHHRFLYRNRAIYFDGVEVGRVVFSNGVSCRFGRKLLINYHGEWFRSGFSCDLAWGFRNMLEEAVFASSPLIDSPDWVNFTDILRLDVAIELKKVRRDITPSQVRWEGPELPAPFGWREHQSSQDGDTEYASKARQALKKRNDRPLLRLYSEHDAEPFSSRWKYGETMRLELEFPKVKTVKGDDKLKEYLSLAAQAFRNLTPWTFVSELDLRPEHEALVDDPSFFVVPAPNFEGVARPEDFVRHPYKGHPAREWERLFAQSATLCERFVRSTITAEMVARMQKGEELVETARPKQASFRFSDDFTEAEKLLVLESTANDAYEVEDLLTAEISLEQIRRVEQALNTYRVFKYPGSKPWAQTFAADELEEWANEPTEWVEKFLTPVVFPERNEQWVLYADSMGYKYLKHDTSGEVYYPGDLQYEEAMRSYEYRRSSFAAKAYTLQAEENKKTFDKQKYKQDREELEAKLQELGLGHRSAPSSFELKND